MEGANPLTAETIVLGLALYFPPTISLLKQKREMCCGTRNLHGLKVRQYTDRLIDLNKYLNLLPMAALSDKVGVTELNNFFLNNMPNSWIKQAYVQVFYCNPIT